MPTHDLDQNYIEEIRQHVLKLRRDMEELESMCIRLMQGYLYVGESLNDARLKLFFKDRFDAFINKLELQQRLAGNELIPWLQKHADELENLLNQG